MTRKDIILQAIKEGKPKKGLYLINSYLSEEEFTLFMISEIKLSSYRIYHVETLAFEKTMNRYLETKNKTILEEYYKQLIEEGKGAVSTIGKDYVQLRRLVVDRLLNNLDGDLPRALESIAHRQAMLDYKKINGNGQEHYFGQQDIQSYAEKHLVASLTRLIKRKWPEAEAAELLYG